MHILITGANGFIAKNVIEQLRSEGVHTIDTVTRATTQQELEVFVQRCDFVFHFAGVNRSNDDASFFESNVDLTKRLTSLLQQYENAAPILATSSIQAVLHNAYGNSKREMEQLLFEHANNTGANVYVYRLPNVFGKWSVPNYNSVVATFCYNVARGLPIDVHHPEIRLTLCYIDDVVAECMRALRGNPTKDESFCKVPQTYTSTLEQLANTLKSFQQSRDNLSVANVSDPLTKKLYSTYVSFLPEHAFSYDLTTHLDQRGSFTEFLRTAHHGQLSINVSKPGVTKGNHWHHTKHEKFLVVSGKANIRFRRLGELETVDYFVSGDKLQVLDIPPGYTHAIENIGETDLVTVMWVNECFDENNPDTYFLEV